MKLIRDLFSGLAVAIAALGLQWALTPWIGTRLPFMVIEPAIIFVAAALGRWPATVVMLVGAANAVVALAPAGHWIATDPASRWAIVAYGVVGALLIAYGGRLHLRDSRAERAEQRLTLAQDETGVGLFELDYQADTAYASPALCQILGQPVMDGSMPLQDWLSALNAGHVADSRRSMQQKVAAGELRYERELRVELPDGQAHWLLSRIRLDLDSRGELAAARGATLDITARKQLLTELELAQAQLRRQLDDLSRLHSLGNQLLAMPFLDAALHAMLDAVCKCHETTFGMLKLLDAEGGMRVAAHCGLADDAVVGLAEATEEAICRRVAASGERIVVADIQADPGLTALHGVARTLGVHALHATPLRASGGGAVLGVFTVLTTAPGQPSERLLRLTDLFAGQAAALIERDKAVSLARETQQRFEVALQSSPVPFTILAPVRDAGGQIIDFSWTYANPAAGGLIDRPAQNLVGRRILDVLPHAWNEPGMLERYVQVSEQGLTFEFETRTQRPDLSRWLQVVASPLNGSVVVWFSDVTQRREEQFALREADRRKDEFLATLAHELRNPLAPIRHAVAIVRDPAASGAQQQWGLAVIDRQLQHMALLLDDLLDVARITRGTLPLRRVRCALQPVVAAAVETAMPLLNERRHRLVVDLADAPMWLDADALRIGQVLGNLLVNAAKYTDPGGEVRLAARLEGDEGNEVVITVTDTGHGLRAEDCERVFEMFTQLSTDDGGPQQGLGIGLALSSRLVQLHGGRLDAASPGLGGGSTFTLHLPAATVMGGEAPAQLDTSAWVRTDTTCRILVADDNRDAADSLALLLGLDGHDVQVAYDGSDALARYRSFRPQIALLDMSMPALSGEELARLIRAEQQAPITLVAITGFGQQQDRERAVDAGFDQHLVKPIQHEQLQAIIDALNAAPQDLPA